MENFDNDNNNTNNNNIPPRPVNKTVPGNYPSPSCDPKKTIIYTTPAAVNPTMGPDPSLVFRGSRPNRPPPPLPKHPIQSPYPSHSFTSKQPEDLTPGDSKSNKPPCPFISQPPLQQPLSLRASPAPTARTSRYPQHPQQVRSVCSPAARMANPYAFGVHSATHTNN